jgi:hypothetical protein
VDASTLDISTAIAGASTDRKSRSGAAAESAGEPGKLLAISAWVKSANFRLALT